VAESSQGKWIRFNQTVLLSDKAVLDHFIEAINKVKDNIRELLSEEPNG